MIEACNHASLLKQLNRFNEIKALLVGTIPVARRVLGESHDTTLKMRWNYAKAFYCNPGATLDDLHEAVTTLEDLARIARRVFGGAHPTTADFEISLRNSRRALRDRESLLAQYLLYGASALAVAAFALVQLRGGSRLVPRARRSFRRWLVPVVRRWARAGT